MDWTGQVHVVIRLLSLGAHVALREVCVNVRPKASVLGIRRERKGERQAEDALYFGPPPPSGTVHVMSCVGVLIEHVLQWMQFCELMMNFLPSASTSAPSASTYS